MTPAAALGWAAAAVGVLLVVGCTATPGPAADPTFVPTTYVDDPAEVTSLRAAAGLDPCPDLPVVGLASAAPPAAARLPDLTLPCLGDGPAVNLAELSGVPYVVNVWAGWCVPCKDEMPYFQEVYQQAGGLVGVLGIDFEDTTVGGLSAAADFGVTFPSVQDLDGRTRSELRFQGPPFTAFVAADGTVVATKSGAVMSAAELRDLITEHLGVTL